MAMDMEDFKFPDEVDEKEDDLDVSVDTDGDDVEIVVEDDTIFQYRYDV